MKSKRSFMGLTALIVATAALTAACGSQTEPVSEPATEAEETAANAAADADVLTGTAEGFGGDIIAEVTVDGDKIVGLTLTGEGETPEVGGAAIPVLEEAILENGGIDGVDGVSGATLTSNGVFAAIEDALGISAEADTEETASNETAAESTADAVSDEAFAEYLTEVKATQYFTDDPVPEEDIETILNAGINAESGVNQQNWHFSAIANKEVQEEIWDDLVEMMPVLEREPDTLSDAMIADAPLAIIISFGEGPGTEFDAGLATQSMNAAALALGYGTKIIASPTLVLNGEKQDYYRELLGIPEDKTVVGALLVGLPLDTSDMDPDTISAASTRNPYSEMTTIVE